MYNTLLVERGDGVTMITLNRPEVRNAFNLELHAELYDALGEAGVDTDARCIVLRGEGPGFSAGADLDAARGASPGEADYGEYLRSTYNRLILRIAEMQKPVVAALHGPVYGAGLGVALACDFRLAAAGSTFCMAFVKIGLIPDAGASFFLPRVVGLGRAMELAMLGDTIDAEHAHRIGLVNQIVADEDLGTLTSQFTSQLAQAPTRALGTIKELLYKSFETDLAAMLKAEAAGQTAMGRTADHREGVTAFFQKRRPSYTGR